MQHLEVSGAVRHIYVIRRLKVNATWDMVCIFPFVIIGFYQRLFIFCSFLARQPLSGTEPSHSRSFWITQNDAPQSVELLWTSYQPVAETSTNKNTTLRTNGQPCPLQDSNPQSQQPTGDKTKLQTALPLGPAASLHCCLNIILAFGFEIVFPCCSKTEQLVGDLKLFCVEDVGR